MSVITNNLLLGDEGYFLTKSLRFRSSASAYLDRTPASASNRKTWTWSAWVKRGTLGTDQVLFGAYDNSSGTDATYTSIGFTSSNTFSVSGWTVYYRNTTQVFRDPSAWYHVVVALDTTQATASNRVKVYVNGSEVTAFGANNNPSQNADLGVNLNQQHGIGRINYLTGSGPYYFDGYMTEINFIDGQALTPSSFGSTNAATGVWQPIKYTGTYGTNGFYLDFKDTSSVAALGYDAAGSNDWTVNNISLTSGSTYDSMKDVPTLTDTDTANYATLNPLNGGLGSFLSEGNLRMGSPVANTWYSISATLQNTGKKYIELTAISGGATRYISFGISTQANGILNYIGSTADSYGYINTAQKYNNGSATSYGATWTDGDIIGLAFDADALTLEFFKNGVSQGVAYTVTSGQYFVGVSTYNYNAAINFGQRPFAYTPPTGFKALNTFNLPTPTIGATASTVANKYFDATLYTGNGSTQSITNSGSMQPDLVWIKVRSNALSHCITDAVRGTNLQLASNSTGADQSTTDGITAFNSNGFSLGAGTQQYSSNTNTYTYVAWQWKANGSGSTNTAGSITSTVSANTTAGFSIVTYTGTGSNATVGHGLGVAPKWVIVKGRNVGSTNWFIYTDTQGATKYLDFSTGTGGTDTSAWNSTAPTSTVFSVGTSYYTNYSATTYVAYCFAQVAGYSAFGSYTGNGSTDGTFVYTGFRPKFVLIKRTDSTGNWTLDDAARSPYNVGTTTTPLLYPNLSIAEANGGIDLLSNGFKIRFTDSDYNTNGATYIYAAFAELPFKYSNAR